MEAAATLNSPAASARRKRAGCKTKVLMTSASLMLLAGLAGCANVGPGLQAWITGPERLLTEDSRPSPESEVYSETDKVIRLRGAVGETLAFQFAARSEQLLGSTANLRLRGQLSDDAFLHEAASCYAIETVEVRQFPSWYPAHTGLAVEPRDVPDVLVPLEPGVEPRPRFGASRQTQASRLWRFDLPARRNALLWVDLPIPAGTQPGRYNGTLAVESGDGRAAFTAKLELEVLPVALPGQPALTVACPVDPRPFLRRAARDVIGSSAETTRVLPSEPRHDAARKTIDALVALLHAHGLAPSLRASFPKFAVPDERRVTLDFEPYAELIDPWLTGRAFADRAALAEWVLPISTNYPAAARHGGLRSPRYAALLGAYARELEAAFGQRDWPAEPIARPQPFGPLSQSSIDAAARANAIVREAAPGIRLVSHLPARSLDQLGWVGAPQVPDHPLDVWAAPARYVEAGQINAQRLRGHAVWFVPDAPPFSPSLTPEAPSTDPRTIGWVAFRYGLTGVWIEDLVARDAAGNATRPLIYDGADYGRPGVLLPSIRLKRLRRGIQDYALLSLLDAQKRSLLAQRVSEQLVRWAFSDATRSHLLDTRGTGWSRDAQAYHTARALLLQELANAFAPSPAGETLQNRQLADWSQLMERVPALVLEPRGVRLIESEGGAREFKVYVGARNNRTGPLIGTWSAPDLPADWRLQAADLRLPAQDERVSELTIAAGQMSMNTAGAYEVVLRADTPTAGAFETTARIAAATCPLIDEAPEIDGQLDDWPLASGNTIGDFRLASRTVGHAGIPKQTTRAAFCNDGRSLFVAVEALLPPGERPLWEADNVIPIAGAQPWGQDVVEVILAPDPTAADEDFAQLYVLQVKPNGLLVARRGPRTDPPICESEAWASGAVVMVRRGGDRYTVELSVPLGEFGEIARGQQVWGANVTRLDARRGEYSSWSAARGYCYSPRALGSLVVQLP